MEWLVQVSYSKKGSVAREMEYIQFKSNKTNTDAIEDRIKQILNESNGGSIYIKGWGDADCIIKVNIVGGKAHIHKEVVNEMHVTAEEAKKFLHDAFIQMKK